MLNKFYSDSGFSAFLSSKEQRRCEDKNTTSVLFFATNVWRNISFEILNEQEKSEYIILETS